MKINNYHYSSLIIVALLTSFMGEGLYTIIKSANVDSYLSIIISIIFTIPLMLLFNFIFNYEPTLNIFEKIKKVSKIPFIHTFLILGITILIAVTNMYNLTNFLVSQYLSETPTYIIGIIFSILIIYINNKGIETLSKVATIIVILNIIMFTISILGLFPEFTASNLLPFLENGIIPPLKGVIYVLSLNIIPLFLLLIIPKDNIKNMKFKNLVLPYAVFTILSLLVIILTIGTLGINLTEIYQYPEYIVLRRINFFDFINRIENILVLQWITGLFVTISLCIYIINQKFNYKYTNYIATIVILIAALYSFKNITVYNSFVYNIFPILSAIFLIGIIILSIKIKITKKD